MARPLRIQYPEAFYHVTSRGNERKAILKDKGAALDRGQTVALDNVQYF
jgi:REP element-mobilizing transposase RayT